MCFSPKCLLSMLRQKIAELCVVKRIIRTQTKQNSSTYMCMTPETPQYTAFFCFFWRSSGIGQNYFTFANPSLQLTYCNRRIIRRIKLYSYYLNNRIFNSLFGLWTFNLILITTFTNLQNKFYFSQQT